MAADVDATPDNGDDFATWVAFRRAKKQGEKKKKEYRGSRSEKNEADGDGQTLDGVKRRTGLRTRSHRFPVERCATQ